MSTPNPATTPWVPVWNLNGGMDLRYNGAWQAGNYSDGDVVVYQGVTYLCVRPTNKAPTPWAPGQLVVQPSVRVYRSTSQSIPNGSWTAISWDSIRYDRGPAVHWNVNQPTRLTCQIAGTYIVWAGVQWNNGGGGNIRAAQIYLNGSIYLGAGGIRGSLQTADYQNSNTPTLVSLNVGDYIELIVWQDSGAALGTLASDGGSNRSQLEFSMALVGGMQGPPGLAANVNYGTTLPPSPADGQEAILVDSVTAPTYQWRFRYNAGHTSDAYKWEFVGGTPWEQIGIGGAFWGTFEGTISTGFTRLTTVGPQFTAPRAGIYDAEGWAIAQNAGGQNLAAFIISTYPSGVGWQGFEAGTVPYAAGSGGSISSAKMITLTAGQVIEMLYCTSNASYQSNFNNRSMRVIPRRIA